MKQQVEQMRNEMSLELDRILAFWKRETIDEEQGGFHGEISSTLEILPEADKGLVLNARILWTFATAYRFFGQQSDALSEYYRATGKWMHGSAPIIIVVPALRLWNVWTDSCCNKSNSHVLLR